jgi:hypothetical protein
MNYYPKVKVREAEIWNVVLTEDKNGLAVHYDRSSEYPGSHYSVLGTYMNSEGFVDFIASLVINGTEYRAEKIRKHYAEVKVLLDQERMEKLLEEIE